ncbi:MAG: c-type cytochrome [Terriglobia bacterium]
MPAWAKGRKNPVAASAQSIAKGRELYKNDCLVCHGQQGAGDGPWAGRLPDSPGNFSDATVMDKMSDGEIFWKISQGRGLMPSYAGRLRAVDRWHLVNYLRTLAQSTTQTQE